MRAMCSQTLYTKDAACNLRKGKKLVLISSIIEEGGNMLRQPELNIDLHDSHYKERKVRMQLQVTPKKANDFIQKYLGSNLGFKALSQAP
eukprot:jgi/Botrbrau1/19920/Bobra.0059s0037.1